MEYKRVAGTDPRDLTKHDNGYRSRCNECFEFMDNCFSRNFYKFGGFVCRHRYIFLIAPVVVNIILSLGSVFLVVADDVEYLFTPEGVRSQDEKAKFQSYFLVGNEGKEFIPDRILSSYLKHGEVIAVSKDGGNILNKLAVEEILNLDERVRTSNYTRNETYFNYETICMRWAGRCVDNPILTVYRGNLDRFDQIYLTHPSMVVPNGPEIFLGSQLVGPDFQNKRNDSEEPPRRVKRVAGFFLVYFLSTGSEIRDDLASVWEQETESMLRQMQGETKYIDIYFAFSYSLQQEVQKASSRVVPRFAATFIMMIVFAVLSLMTFDWVVSRPLLGMIGVLSAGFAILSSVGLLAFLGLDFNEIVAMMPFLVIGVGVDDMFIMVAAWRQMGFHIPLEEKMSKTYSEAAVSITITNVTDVLAFLVGATTPIPAVRMFCIYTGVAMIFAYLYQITFFGACMAFFGERELQNRHCLTFHEVLPLKEAKKSKGILYRIFCTGGRSLYEQKGIKDENVKHPLVTFFRNYYSPLLKYRSIKIAATLLFFVCITGSVVGCLSIKEGLRLQNLAPDYSDPWLYYRVRDNYLPSFCPTVSVMIEGRLDYSDRNVQDHVESLTMRLEESKFAYSSKYTISWLRTFLWYLQNRPPSLQKQNMSSAKQETDSQLICSNDETLTHCNHSGLKQQSANLLSVGDQVSKSNFSIEVVDETMNHNTQLSEATFIQILKEEFLADPRFSFFKLDIVFENDSQNGSYINASRLVLPTKGAEDALGERDLMLDLRERGDDPHLNVTVYNPMFLVFDQYIGIVSYTMQALSIAMVCMFIVALVMIPHPVCAIFVTLCAVSIDAAVLGYMSLWDVSLDIVSVVNIILCIGFSVDFSAHITYAFVTATNPDSTERAIHALRALGTPILQSALSSIIALSPLSKASVYIFRVFFKTLFLVMVFGAMHGLIFLPVFLSFLGNCLPAKTKKYSSKHTKSKQNGICLNACSEVIEAYVTTV